MNNSLYIQNCKSSCDEKHLHVDRAWPPTTSIKLS